MKRLRYLLCILVILIGIAVIPVYAIDYNSSDTIMSVQNALNKKGYDCGAADGIIGNNTRTQIASFRKDAHIGECSDIDSALLWALRLTDEPFWLPFQNEDDANTVIEHLTDEYREMARQGYTSIGSTTQDSYDVGNYIQYGHAFEFGAKIVSDNNSLLLVTAMWTGSWNLVSICNYDTGEYYFKNKNIFGDDTVSGYSASSIQPSSILSGGVDSRVVSISKTNNDSRTQEVSQEEVYEEESQESQSTGTSYVLNTNTRKFHYPSCASADDIKPSNRWDYVGTREEVIAMGYEPCKRCYP